METMVVDKEIKVFYVTAASFPDGVLEAHKKLHALVPFSTERKYFGISRPEDGKIEYKAATEETHAGEAAALHCSTLVLKKGWYAYITIADFRKDIPAIQQAFNRLLEHPELDPAGYCVEWYSNDADVTCMVRLSK